MLPPEEMTGLNFCGIGRESTSSHDNKTSTDQQLSKIREEVEKRDGNLVKIFDLTESAATIDRDSLDEVLELAKEDKIDVLAVWKLDRLTRASPWESVMYLNKLREQGVILYAHTHGYFEWEDLYDFEMLARRVVFAREWYQRIIEGGREGQMKKLEAGKWPYGTSPHGYTTDENQVIRLTDEGRTINRDIIQLYLEHENMKKVLSEINDRYEKNVSKSQIENILQNKIVVGDLTLKGQVVAHNEDLKLTDRETFDKVQDIRAENSSAPSNTRNIPEPIDRAANRFGVEFVLEIMSSVGKQCRKCGDDVRANGTTERWGTVLRKYVCKNEDCGYEGPLLKQSEFNDLHQRLPLRCPYCPITNRYEVEQRPGGLWEYKYTCDTCDKSFGSDISPDKIKRVMDNPRLTFKWGDKTDLSDVEHTECENTDASEGTDDKDTDETEQTDQSQNTWDDY